MFLLFGRRYPWISLAGGAAFLAIGLLAGSPLTALVGCLGLVTGGYRMVTSVRRGGRIFGARPGGGIGMGGWSGSGGPRA